jgi:hypothetical protein
MAVKDTRIEIPKAKQSRIFDCFYRIESDRFRKTGGTGLGLAIAQAIADHHQGHITVKSDRSQGSLFIVRLPCSQFIAHHKIDYPMLDRYIECVRPQFNSLPICLNSTQDDCNFRPTIKFWET